MNCPACANTLTPKTAGGVEVDVCAGGCGGIWFAQFEFKKFDEPAEAAGEQLLDVPTNGVVVDRTKRYGCPRCTDGVVMLRHFESVKRQVTLDECPECGGIWLDAGELRTIRDEFPSEEARHAAADAYFHDVADRMLAREHAKTEADLQRAQRFSHALRFICPSYYAAGEQDWGAF